MVKSLDELKEKEKMFNNSKLVQRGVKMENTCDTKPEAKTKMCPNCGVTKTLDQYHVDNKAPDGHVKFCKECAMSRRQKQTEQHARDIFYKDVVPYTKKEKAIFTVSDIWDKFAKSKVVGYNLLKTMVELKLLSATKKGVTNYYEIPNKEEGQYDNLTENFENKNDETDMDVDAIDPITDKEVKELQDLGVEVKETKGIVFKEVHTPKQTLLSTLDMIYNEAKEIKIIPATHEIYIKMME